MYKKFALIGTSCVGKTTFLAVLEELLRKKYRDKTIVTVPEAARYYFEKRHVRKRFSYTNQRNIQTLAKQFEKKAILQKPDIIICDRSVLDAVAYVNAMGTKKETKKLVERIKSWLPTYSHYFLLDPKGVNYETDLTRKEDIRAREAFHVSFLFLLQELRLPYTLISGSKTQRIKKMLKIISTLFT